MCSKILFERLKQGSIDYVANSIIGETRAEVEFIGDFEGQSVLWSATIVALKDKSAVAKSQYIEVGEAKNNSEPLCFRLEIGLQVSLINEPTIIKVIKMVRQFKNLQRGRHEFLGTNK